MRTVALGVCVWLCAAVCSAASPFDGTWAGTFIRSAPAGNQDVTMTISTDQGGKVSGSMTLQGVTGEVPIEWGFVKDDLITYRVRVLGQCGGLLLVHLPILRAVQIGRACGPDDLGVGLLVKGTAKRVK